MTDTADRVLAVIAKHLCRDVSTVTPDKTLGDELGADEFDRIELAIMIEEEFNIDIGDATLEGWITVSDIIRTVEECT
jgi:acyl carrier protein